VTDGRTAGLARYRQDSAICLGRDIMHPMFKELFIETDAEDLVAEEDWRRPRAPVPANPMGHGRQASMAMTPGPGQSATLRDG
jgi:hypothetical protein